MAAPNTTAAAQVPRGQVDLVDFIDWTGLECLNQDSSHNIANALKQVPCRALPPQVEPSLVRPLPDSAGSRFSFFFLRGAILVVGRFGFGSSFCETFF
jgi:hypothetical protein